MERRQLILFGGIFVVISAVLLAIYLLLFKQDYVALYENLREQDTAAIAKEMDKQEIAYRLEDGGHTILVPQGELNQARVAIAGSDIQMGGVVGFELFNESDMGLTEFAQKVNYQRALQGELARTIMMTDGISFARVHLSLPERSLFRQKGEGPTAAVSVQPETGLAIGADRVEGIQRLVAASVSEMTPADVAVLDEDGRLISPEILPQAMPGEGDLDERTALEEYYRARARKAVEQILPSLPFTLRVTAIALVGQGADEAAFGGDGSGGLAGVVATSPKRNFALRIAMRTEVEVAEGDREDLRKAIQNAVAFDPRSGDILRFEVAPLEYQESPAASVRTASPAERSNAVPVPAVPSRFDPVAVVTSSWFWLGLLLVLAIAMPMWRQRARLSRAEQKSFAEMLGQAVAIRREEQRG